MSRDDRGETTPLLPPAASEVADRPLKVPDRRAIRAWLLVIVIFLDFAAFLSVPAQNVIFEQIICDHYTASLNGTSPPEGFPPTDPCKSTAVQAELGDLLGWKDTFEMLPGFLFALPWGMLGDRWGRVPVLFCSLTGLVLTEAALRVITYWPSIFPIRGIWYVQFITAFGGGATVAQSMIFTMTADITKPSERADFFTLLHASVLFSELVATPVGGFLAEASHPWVPYILSPILLGLGGLLVWILPETLPPRKDDTEAVDRDWGSLMSKYWQSFNGREIRHRVVQRIRRAPRLLWQNLTLAVLVAVSSVAVLSRQSTNFVVLFASKRLEWSLARASMLATFRSLSQLLTLLLLLPLVTHLLLQKFGFSVSRKDLFLLRSQAALVTLGAFMIAFSSHVSTLILGLVVSALGAGFHVNSRSLATTLVRREHFAAMNTALAMGTSAGVLVAGPLLAAMWKRGLQLGGQWLGLPSFLVGCLFGVVAMITWCLSVKEGQSSNDDDEQDDEIHDGASYHDEEQGEGNEAEPESASSGR